jgi:hypothetical protein
VPLESNEISDERRKNELLKAWRFAWSSCASRKWSCRENDHWRL